MDVKSRPQPPKETICGLESGFFPQDTTPLLPRPRSTNLTTAALRTARTSIRKWPPAFATRVSLPRSNLQAAPARLRSKSFAKRSTRWMILLGEWPRSLSNWLRSWTLWPRTPESIERAPSALSRPQMANGRPRLLRTKPEIIGCWGCRLISDKGGIYRSSRYQGAWITLAIFFKSSHGNVKRGGWIGWWEAVEVVLPFKTINVLLDFVSCLSMNEIPWNLSLSQSLGHFISSKSCPSWSLGGLGR